MGIITRSEAAYRLKLISTKVNNSVSDIRDGDWTAGHQAATEAWALLELLLPHLEEAANDPANATPVGKTLLGSQMTSVGSLPYGVPPPLPKRDKAFGYRGGHNGDPTPAPVKTSTSSYTAPKPIITPPPPIKTKVTSPKAFAMGPITPPAPVKPPTPVKPPVPEPPPYVPEPTAQLVRCPGEYAKTGVLFEKETGVVIKAHWFMKPPAASWDPFEERYSSLAEAKAAGWELI